MILGFDASTTVCGWAMYNGSEICDAGFINIEPFETNKEKAFHVIQTLSNHQSIGLVSAIRLEAALSGFMGGRTSQQVIIKLARFNAVFEYILGEHYKVPVTLIGAQTARKKVLGKAHVKGKTAKEYVREQLPKIIPYIEQYYKLNKLGNYDKKNEDMLDAIVIAMS